jgi:acylphosphatase
MIRAEVRFIGRVQGVGFRATTLHIARRFRVTGWVRNETDGSVYLVAEGHASEVNSFLESLQKEMARCIRSTRRHDAEPKGEAGFDIRH